MSTITAGDTNKVVRLYAITPLTPPSVSGHKQKPSATVTVGLRYSEADIIHLHRDSAEAAAEALKVARRRRDVPEGVEAEVVCIRETLKPNNLPPAA